MPGRGRHSDDGSTRTGLPGREAVTAGMEHPDRRRAGRILRRNDLGCGGRASDRVVVAHRPRGRTSSPVPADYGSELYGADLDRTTGRLRHGERLDAAAQTGEDY